MKINGFYISPGNTKVRFPIVNLGSGTDCPSRSWCPFSMQTFRSSGRKLCYAQKIERLRKNVLDSRRRNAMLIQTRKISPVDIADAIDSFFQKYGTPYGRTVRINESGDLSRSNIVWCVSLIRALKRRGISTYLYSKAPAHLQDYARCAGAVVLHSERDFVAVKSARDTSLKMCPGLCGPCKRCPQGLQSAILEH
jgi:hypothetical protein